MPRQWRSVPIDWAIALGVVIQASAVALIFGRLKGRIFAHCGAVLILVAVAYHGLNEILLWIFPGQDSYRHLISQAVLDRFVLWISAAILLLTLAYLTSLGSFWRPPSSDTAGMRRVFEWRLTLLGALPLVVLTAIGEGYNTRTALGQPLGAGAGFSAQFLLLFVVCATVAVVLRFGRGAIVPMILIQSVGVSLIGERLEILIAAAMVVYVLARFGMSVSRRELAVICTVFALGSAVITGARVAEGHVASYTGSSLRPEYLWNGIGSIGSADFWQRVASDFGHRMDGNSFGAMELAALDQGQRSLGLMPLFIDLRAAVPSFIYHDKTGLPISDQSEKEYEDLNLGLPLPYLSNGTHQDIIPTQLGASISYWGPFGMLAIACLLGFVLGRADRWILNATTASRTLIGVTLLSSVLLYERSWSEYFISLRGLVLLLAFVWIVQHRPARTLRKKDFTEEASLAANRWPQPSRAEPTAAGWPFQ